jgi:hypothetical protein
MFYSPDPAEQHAIIGSRLVPLVIVPLGSGKVLLICLGVFHGEVVWQAGNAVDLSLL